MGPSLFIEAYRYADARDARSARNVGVFLRRRVLVTRAYAEPMLDFNPARVMSALCGVPATSC